MALAWSFRVIKACCFAICSVRLSMLNSWAKDFAYESMNLAPVSIVSIDIFPWPQAFSYQNSRSICWIWVPQSQVHWNVITYEAMAVFVKAVRCIPVFKLISWIYLSLKVIETPIVLPNIAKEIFWKKIASALKDHFWQRWCNENRHKLPSSCFHKTLVWGVFFLCFAYFCQSLMRTKQISLFLKFFYTENYFSVWHLLFNFGSAQKSQ